MAEKTMKKNFKRNNTKNKKRDYGTKNENARIATPDFCGRTFEYKMPQEMADDILRDDKSKGSAQEVLCEYVNSQFGLLGYCVKVLIS